MFPTDRVGAGSNPSPVSLYFMATSTERAATQEAVSQHQYLRLAVRTVGTREPALGEICPIKAVGVSLLSNRELLNQESPDF